MNDEIVQTLLQHVRAGKSLRQAIAEQGLERRATLIYLQKNHRQKFRDAKARAQRG